MVTETDTDRLTLEGLIKRDGITIEATKGAPVNPEMPKTHQGWTCTLTRGSATMQTPFYQSEFNPNAEANKRTRPTEQRGDSLVSIMRWERKNRRPAPTVADVLSCLCMDASGYDSSRNFEEWAGDYGYDTDSRKAERVYQTISEQAKALRHFLGDAYAEYLDAGNEY